MTSHEILKADLLDILFDNRNKQYGAYALRRQYHSRLGLALGISLSTILLLLFFLQPGSSGQNHLPFEKKPDVRITEIPLIPKVPEPPVQPAPPLQKVATSSYSHQIKMVDNTNPEREMKPVEEIKFTALGPANAEGPMVPEIQSVRPQEASAVGKPRENEESPAFVPLEKTPEFPGGPQAWANFLNRFLQAPEDLEPGEKKMVLVSFLVDVDGSVTGFRVVQSGGQAFDREVIRVLKKMPRWTPAIQNGRPVAVPFTQPVTFVAPE